MEPGWWRHRVKQIAGNLYSPTQLVQCVSIPLWLCVCVCIAEKCGVTVFAVTILWFAELVLIGTGPAIPLFTEFGAPKAVVAEAINIFLWKAPSLRPPAQVTVLSSLALETVAC